MKVRLSHLRFVAYAVFFSTAIFSAGTIGWNDIDAAGSFAPSVDSVRIGTSANGADVNPLNLTAGSNTTFHVNGTVSDLDGAWDISTVQATLYRSSVWSWCTADTNNCYYHPSCTITNATGTTADYNCEFDVTYFADATDADSWYPTDTWKAYISVSDSSWWMGWRDDYNNEINSLRAISTTGSIAYGNLGLGQTTSTPATISIINQGNTMTSAEFSSTGMNCTYGSIPPHYQKFNTFWTSYASMQYTLSTTPANPNLFIQPQWDDYTISSSTIYWHAQVPTVGVSGNCTGFNTVNAVAPVF